ncbi:MAG: DUF2742 domain-containing protein [Mycolicibacterium sp.]|uniref:DUF2742 domain-containing protein n=1 Tax=Mycolicibacterium sp. TaxID=2320850 RepID=UPI000FA2236D|nr:DUF2742 domain-containing protein [Mycolicibacterium sp.]RUP35016.1 MAG: DUF2742 domain-containing protein [Mycolicibacterium sp.]
MTLWLNTSHQVNWWEVHEFVTPLLSGIDNWPLLGTPAWSELPDDHPAKLAAILDASQHYALFLDGRQEALAEAGREIACADDWPALARRVAAGLGEAYVPRHKEIA